jgi:hypothetical protein
VTIFLSDSLFRRYSNCFSYCSYWADIDEEEGIDGGMDGGMEKDWVRVRVGGGGMKGVEVGSWGG